MDPIPTTVVGQKKNKIKLQQSDEMTEIFLPGDVKPGIAATGLLDKNTNTLLINIDGDSPEDIARDPSTPKMFQDLDQLEILHPQIKEVNGKSKLELPKEIDDSHDEEWLSPEMASMRAREHERLEQMYLE